MIFMNILEHELKHKFFMHSLTHFLLKSMLEKQWMYLLFNKFFIAH